MCYYRMMISTLSKNDWQLHMRNYLFSENKY